MGIRLFKEPELEKPVLICGWPGLGVERKVDAFRGLKRGSRIDL